MKITYGVVIWRRQHVTYSLGHSIDSLCGTKKQIYQPGTLETHWLRSKKAGHICETILSQKQMNRIWTNFPQDVFIPDGKSPRDPTTAEHQVLSHMWTAGVPGPSQPIEPLSGVARHPGAPVCKSINGTTNLFDISYLIIPDMCNVEAWDTNSRSHYNRIRFFDLGCTVYRREEVVKASGAGPSIPLFCKMYKSRCMEFDDIYAWEAIDMKPSKWWQGVPPYMREPISGTPYIRTLYERLPYPRTSSERRGH